MKTRSLTLLCFALLLGLLLLQTACSRNPPTEEPTATTAPLQMTPTWTATPTIVPAASWTPTPAITPANIDGPIATATEGPPFGGGEQWILTVPEARLQFVSPTKDGGFLVLGYMGEPGNDFPHWLLKLNEVGTVEWQRRFTQMYAYGVTETGDGGVVIIEGESLVRLHADGTLDWRKRYSRPLEQLGGPPFGLVQTVRATDDGGTQVLDYGSFVSTLDQNGALISQIVYPPATSKFDAYNTVGEKVDWVSPEGLLNGELITDREYKITRWSPTSPSWEMIFSFASFDVPGFEPHFILGTHDGGVLFGAPVRHLLGYPAFAHWIVRIDREGKVLWHTVLDGGSDWEFAVHEAPDGGFVLAAASSVYLDGASRIYLRLLKLNASGNLVWERIYGDSQSGVNITAIVDTSDHGFLLAGKNGPLGDSFEVEDGDLILMKLDRYGKIPGCGWMRETPFNPPVRKSPTHTIRTLYVTGTVDAELIESDQDLTSFELVEGHATVQAKCVYPEAPVPTPTSLPIPSPQPTQSGRVYPIIGGDGIVIGGVLDNRWVDAPTTEALLVADEKYRVFLGGLTYLGDATAFPILTPADEPCAGSLKLRWEPPVQPEALALSGSWDPLPRLTSSLSLELPVYQDALTELLRANGIRNPVGHLTSLQRIDLDGDGSDEVLMGASRLENGLESTSVAKGDYALVVVRKLVDERIVTIPLIADYYISAQSDVVPRRYEVTAVMDLNADGDMEIVLDAVSVQGRQTYVFEIIGETGREVLHVTCRVLPAPP